MVKGGSCVCVVGVEEKGVVAVRQARTGDGETPLLLFCTRTYASKERSKSHNHAMEKAATYYEKRAEKGVTCCQY